MSSTSFPGESYKQGNLASVTLIWVVPFTQPEMPLHISIIQPFRSSDEKLSLIIIPFLGQMWFSYSQNAYCFLQTSTAAIFKVKAWFPRPVALVSPGNLLEAQIFRPHSRPTESATLEVGPSNSCFNRPPRWFWCTLKFENKSSILPPISLFRVMYGCLTFSLLV